MATVARAKPDFGLDGPPVVAIFVGIGAVGVALLVVTAATGVSLAGPGWALVSIGLLTTGLMVHSSKRGKVLVQDKVLNQLGFRGSEDVLDLGCGSGLMLLGAATRAPQGTATGIDLWRLVDQVGSSRDSCMANARALGVADRVTLVDGDMSDLPFEDGTFDVVLACLAIHNIHDSVSVPAPLLRRRGCYALAVDWRSSTWARPPSTPRPPARLAWSRSTGLARAC